MKIKVYVTGDKPEKFYLEAIKEYEKRLTRYCNISYKHFKNAESLIKAVSDKDYKVALSLKGTTVSSEKLAERINHLGLTGFSDLTIIIGTPYEGYDEQLTMSNMEMDVWLKTTILFEQIYRAYRIMNNHPYHK